MLGYARLIWSRLRKLFMSEMPAWAFFLDFVIYPPVILASLYLAFADADAGQVLGGIAMVLAGGILWTLAEYLIHRFAFHHVPLLKPVHMAHHHAPRELNGTPTLLTVLIFVVGVYVPLGAMIGWRMAAAATAGVMLGYLAYVSVHYVVHHMGSGGLRPLRRLIKLHAVHHHDTEHNFGVTSDFWDRVFGTLAKR